MALYTLSVPGPSNFLWQWTHLSVSLHVLVPSPVSLTACCHVLQQAAALYGPNRRSEATQLLAVASAHPVPYHPRAQTQPSCVLRWPSHGSKELSKAPGPEQALVGDSTLSAARCPSLRPMSCDPHSYVILKHRPAGNSVHKHLHGDVRCTSRAPRWMLVYCPRKGRDWSSGGRVGNAGSSSCSEGQEPLKAVCQWEEGEETASTLIFYPQL